MSYSMGEDHMDGGKKFRFVFYFCNHSAYHSSCYPGTIEFKPLAHSFFRKMAPSGMFDVEETNTKTPIQAPTMEKRCWGSFESPYSSCLSPRVPAGLSCQVSPPQHPSDTLLMQLF